MNNFDVEELPEWLEALENERVGHTLNLADLSSLPEKERKETIKKFVNRKPEPDEHEKHVEHLKKICAAFEKFYGCSYEEVSRKIRAKEINETWPICRWSMKVQLLKHITKKKK